MSSTKQPTRERILDRALDLFNEHGIEGVGMRDLARDLDLSPGNLTYHFPKKEDVIVAIAEQLTALNSRSHMAVEQPDDLAQFLAMFGEIFRNHYQYRCLLLSIVHLHEHYPAMAARYRGVQEIRTGSFQVKLVHLCSTGSLREDLSELEIRRMAAYCALIGRFWISEYWVSYRDRPLEEMIDHYLDLLAGVFLPYATQKGKEEINALQRLTRSQ